MKRVKHVVNVMQCLFLLIVTIALVGNECKHLKIARVYICGLTEHIMSDIHLSYKAISDINTVNQLMYVA